MVLQLRRVYRVKINKQQAIKTLVKLRWLMIVAVEAIDFAVRKIKEYKLEDVPA